jgi:hypothetical protein
MVVLPARKAWLTVVDRGGANHLILLLQVWIEELGVMKVIRQLLPFVEVLNLLPMLDIAFAAEPGDGMDFRMNGGH